MSVDAEMEDHSSEGDYAAAFDKEKYKDMEPRQLHDELKLSHTKFSKACDQLLLIDDRVKQIEVRYQRAVANHKESSRYSQRLNLSIMTGLKCVMYEYAMRMAAQVEGIRKIAENYADVEDDYFYSDGDTDEEEDEDEDEVEEEELEEDNSSATSGCDDDTTSQDSEMAEDT